MVAYQSQGNESEMLSQKVSDPGSLRFIYGSDSLLPMWVHAPEASRIISSCLTLEGSHTTSLGEAVHGKSKR